MLHNQQYRLRAHCRRLREPKRVPMIHPSSVRKPHYAGDSCETLRHVDLPVTRPVLYIGPSLCPDELKGALRCDVDVRPPIRRGDLVGVGGDAHVAIVDGVFLSSLAVTVREVFDLLKRGATVYGSSSMGALRAAELSRYGMKGIGAVYDMYARGEINSDAEVALTFNPETFRALTEPLVNIRYALRSATARGIIGLPEAESLLMIARDIHFIDLTYEVLFQKASHCIGSASLSRFQAYVRENRAALDLKRLDALSMVRMLNERYASIEFC